MQNDDPSSVDHAPVQVDSPNSTLEPLAADPILWYKPQRSCTKDASTAVTESMQQFNQYQRVNLEVNLHSADAIRVDDTRKMTILVIGSIAVGKTSLINRIRQKPFKLTQPPTINITPTVIGATVQHQDCYIVQLVDTAGEERFGAVMQSYYKRADGAMVVYDATSPNSLDTVTNWESALRKHAKIDDNIKFPIFLLGNKADLNETYIDGSQMADDLKMDGFFKTSARTGEGITDAVKMMISLIHFE